MEMVTVTLLVSLICGALVPLGSALLTTAPSLECLDDALRLHFVPEVRPFLGHVYVKGFFYSSRCHLDYTQYSMAEPFFFHIPYRSDCQIRRERLNDPRGVSYTVTVVVQHHRLFVTSIDKAYSVSCFYRDTQTRLENAVQIGDLTTQVITQSDGTPACAYDVLQGTIDGPIAKYANIGDTLVHRFSCDSPNMGILVHSCYVRDGVGNEFALLDERGCSTDTSLVVPITYTDDLTTAFAPISAFKFADQMIIYFTCQITLCSADNNGCEGITPPQCTPTPLPGQPGGTSVPVTSTNENGNGSYGNFEDTFPETENIGALPVRPPTRNYTATPLPPIYSTTEQAATTTTTTTTTPRPTTSTSTSTSTTTTTTTRAPQTTTTPYLIPPPTTTNPYQLITPTPGYPPSIPPNVVPRPTTTQPPGNAYGYGGAEAPGYGQQPNGYVNAGNSGGYNGNEGPSTPYETGATTAGANIFNRGWGQTGGTVPPSPQVPVEPIPQPLMPNMFRNEFASARHARDLPQNHPDTITVGVTADQLIVFTREDKDVPQEIMLDEARKAAEQNETASEQGGEASDVSVGEVSATCGRSMSEFFWIAAFFVSLIGFGITLFVQRHHYEQKLRKQPKTSFKAHPQIVTLSYP